MVVIIPFSDPPPFERASSTVQQFSKSNSSRFSMQFSCTAKLSNFTGFESTFFEFDF